ncbi:MAG: hypothetical protein JRH20_00915 [Deltaproteobacteria bacterium]|nr:hypothetical protein [Deltaproteobacteria bacterium]
MKKILLLTVASLLLPMTAGAAQFKYVQLKGTLGRDGSFNFPAHKRRAEQHYVQSKGQIHRHPNAAKMKLEPIAVGSTVAVTMPDNTVKIMSVGDLQKLQRSYAANEVHNQNNRRIREARKPKSNWVACSLEKGQTEIQGKDLVQSWEQNQLLSFLAKKRGVPANSYDRTLKTPSIARVRLMLPANSIQLATLEAGTKKFPFSMSLKGATGSRGGLFNGRPISQWEAFVALDRTTRTKDGNPRYQVGLKAFASEYSSGTGGSQQFLSKKSFTAAELNAGLLTTLTDGLVAQFEAAQTSQKK